MGFFPVQAWAVQGVEGAPFSVELISHEFIGILILLGPGIDVGEYLDSGDAGRCNARISLTFPEDGEYRLIVSSLRQDTGSFRLLASNEISAGASSSCVADVSLAEIAIEGSLTLEQNKIGMMRGDESYYDGRPLQGW